MTKPMDQFLELYSVYYDIDINDIEYIKKAWDDSDKVKTCAYIFTKGPRKNQLCIGDVDDQCYCKLHTGCEKTGQKMKKGHATPTNCKIRGMVVKNKAIERDASIYIVKHKNHDFYWHRESGFVFDKKTKRVISIYSENTISKLNEQDKKICKNYGFKVLLE